MLALFGACALSISTINFLCARGIFTEHCGPPFPVPLHILEMEGCERENEWVNEREQTSNTSEFCSSRVCLFVCLYFGGRVIVVSVKAFKIAIPSLVLHISMRWRLLKRSPSRLVVPLEKWPRCIFPGMKTDQRFYFFPLKKSKEHYLYQFSLWKLFCIEKIVYF